MTAVSDDRPSAGMPMTRAGRPSSRGSTTSSSRSVRTRTARACATPRPGWPGPTHELTAGYTVDPVKLVNDAIFTVDYDEMVVVTDIDFYSLCEHHLLPFYGRAHVAYMPRGRVIGLSKIPRIVDMFARRLQVQERMTVEIADLLEGAVDPAGVAVVVEGVHLCSVMRGVRKENARMVTSAMRGAFRHDEKTRSEFLGLIQGKGRL